MARLYTDGSFRRQLAAQFEAYEKLEFHLAPPILGRRDDDGRLRKSNFGPWMMKAFGLLAGLKGLRGTRLDIFGYTAERRMERELLRQYEADLDLIERDLSADRIEAGAALASVPALIRGFGHVKEANAERAAQERKRLLQRFQTGVGASILEAAE